MHNYIFQLSKERLCNLLQTDTIIMKFSIEIVERLGKRNRKFLKICQTKTFAFASHI